MLSVIYCTRESNPRHTEHLINTSGLLKNIQVIEIINNGESLTKAYARGLAQTTNDIVVFCHDDLTITTKQWGKKLLKHYEHNEDYGILGVAGTKYLATNGRWWEKRNKMYGIVDHTHLGKTSTSKYSNDIVNGLEEVIVVDGVFFSINKKRIKKNFDTSVEGFHFYDIDFCFQNYLAGVKIGVHTNIRINHQSIGITNDKWETNRANFADKYKDNLPVTIKKVLRKGEKLKVLIGCLNFNSFTGSELYVFELAKALIELNCDVSITSNLGKPLADIAHRYGIKMYSLEEPPNFKLGDGKWEVKTPNGFELSKENSLYKISDRQFDIIHVNHKPVTENLIRLYPDTDMIATIHSEVIALEDPVISPQIKKYIAIRPEIKEHLISKFDIAEDKISVIYNPIDCERFYPKPERIKRNKKRILFVGTIDYLRKNAIQDLITTTENNNQELWIVGKQNDVYLTEMIKDKSHVTYFPPTSAPTIEKYINQCDETAGILLGRTTIEGWMCGKNGWIYNIDNFGNIISKELYEVPNDIYKFNSKIVAKQIIEEYKNILS